MILYFFQCRLTKLEKVTSLRKVIIFFLIGINYQILKEHIRFDLNATLSNMQRSCYAPTDSNGYSVNTCDDSSPIDIEGSDSNRPTRINEMKFQGKKDEGKIKSISIQNATLEK